MITIQSLENGIKVALEPIEYVRSISFGIWVKNGSRNETKQQNGMSHYIEHMMFKGTIHRSATDIAQEMDALGGQINAYTTKEYTCYHTRVLDEHIEKAVDVMSDMLLTPLFAQEDIEKERNVILEEILMYDDAPEELVHDCLQDSIWRGSSLGMPILGTKQSIAGIDANNLKAYYERNYHTKNIVLSVAGHFVEEEMMALLNRYFGQFQSNYEYEPFETKARYEVANIQIKKDIEQLHTCIAFRGLERNHRLKYAMGVFNTIFGGGMSAMLFQKIREECGLTYSIYSYTTSFVDTGLFCIYASMNPTQLEMVYQKIAKEIRLLQKQGIAQNVMERTKQQMASNFIIGAESTLNRMTASGASLLLRGMVQEPYEIMKKIESVTEQDLAEVISYLFDGDVCDISTCAVGNVKNIAFADIVKHAFV